MINRQFDSISVQQIHAMEAVHSLKDVLLRIHNDSFSLEDYYLMINELIHRALTSLSEHVDGSDLRLLALKAEVQSVFHHWNSIVPTSSTHSMWAAEIMNIIGKMKETKQEQHLAMRTTPLLLKELEIQVAGPSSESNIKEKEGNVSVGTGNSPNMQSHQ
jgi:hypothetical protein